MSSTGIKLGSSLTRQMLTQFLWQDQRLGVELYKKSANQGHPQGLFNLSHCYRFGRGVIVNHRCVPMLLSGMAGLGSAAGALQRVSESWTCPLSLRMAALCLGTIASLQLGL
jgi:hypothetical protein